MRPIANITIFLIIILGITACGPIGKNNYLGEYTNRQNLRDQERLTTYGPLEEMRELETFEFGNTFSPRPFLLRDLPGGDDSYSVGFRDGCATTINFNVGLVRTHPFSYNVDRGLKDKQYYAGYRAGTVYCVYFADVDPL